MTLYLVRHGESEGNVGKRFQSHEERLTTLGEKQAKAVAMRFSKIKIDAVIASTMTRAQQTAGEIAKVVGKEIIPQPLFIEIKQPTDVVGKQHTDQNAVTIIEKVKKNRHNPAFHYSDEENYFDFISRVDFALQTLEEYGDDEQVVVVAHGHVVRAVIGIILFGTELSARNFDQLIDHTTTANTGISVAKFSPERGWQLVSYNDHAHLLE